MKSQTSSTAIAACFVLVLCSAVVHADSFTPHHLFTLPYGSEPGQIGISLPELEEGLPDGPTGIAVGPDGSIYIADAVNRRIQRFSPSGELLMEAKAPVERKAEHIAAEQAHGWGAEFPRQLKELENIQYLAVDSQGNVYALFGPSMGLLAKFAADGQGLWYMAIGNEVPFDVTRTYTYGGSYGDPTIGPGDSLCLGMGGRGVALLDADARFLRAVSGYACTPNGRIAAFETARGSLATAMRMYDADGVELAYFVADLAAADPALLVGMDGLSGIAFDGMDNLYTFAIGGRDQGIVLSPQLRIVCDEVIVRFDASGRAAAGVRFPGDPFPTGRSSTVDYAGNIYRLAFSADSVDVIKYVLDTSTREYSSLRED